MRLSERLLAKLAAGEARDMAVIAEPVTEGLAAGTFKLKPGGFVPDSPNMDYVDSGIGRSINSIGREISTGEVFASFDTRYNRNPLYELLWMRWS